MTSTITTSSASVDDPVGHGLVDAYAGELGDLVVERLEVLDVDRRPDVDPSREDVEHVFEALLVLEARGVGVRKLVDQHPVGSPGEDPRKIHL